MRLSLIAFLAFCISAQVAAHDRLPLGDGKVSDIPSRGYVMACRLHMPPGRAPGAFRTGEWIADGAWDPDGKPIVEGMLIRLRPTTIRPCGRI